MLVLFSVKRPTKFDPPRLGATQTPATECNHLTDSSLPYLCEILQPLEIVLLLGEGAHPGIQTLHCFCLVGSGCPVGQRAWEMRTIRQVFRNHQKALAAV